MVNYFIKKTCISRFNYILKNLIVVLFVQFLFNHIESFSHILILNKLDGTAKGGIVLSIKRELGIPVKFIGVGEKIDDMKPFSPDEFAKALFEKE